MSERGKISLLVFFLAICGTAALLHHRLGEEPTDPARLYQLVSMQIEACRVEDFPRAYQQASSGFQQRINIEEFQEMVRGEYTGFISAARVEFGAIQQRGNRATLPVFFIDRDGKTLPCIYNLIQEGEGWKIDGAQVIRHWGARISGLRA